MAKPPDPFHEFVIELFAPMGPVSVKRMFGGAGVFRDGLMFALIADDTLFLKTDAALRALAARPDVLVVAATDANDQGERYAERLRDLANEAGCNWQRLRPPAEDWNACLTKER